MPVSEYSWAGARLTNLHSCYLGAWDTLPFSRKFRLTSLLSRFRSFHTSLYREGTLFYFSLFLIFESKKKTKTTINVREYALTKHAFTIRTIKEIKVDLRVSKQERFRIQSRWVYTHLKHEFQNRKLTKPKNKWTQTNKLKLKKTKKHWHQGNSQNEAKTYTRTQQCT